MSTQKAYYWNGFTPEELEEFTIYQAVGCDACTDGYKGRVGMYQVMPMTEKLKHLFLQAVMQWNLPRLQKQKVLTI